MTCGLDTTQGPRCSMTSSSSHGQGSGSRWSDPNGSGKSTLGRLLVGLLRPQRRGTSGSPGRTLRGSRLPCWPGCAGYVFQRPEQQFLASARDRRDPPRPCRNEVDGGRGTDGPARLPLGTFGERSPYRLSGGEQRRLSLAVALIRRPGVLILDEPTFGQDRHGYERLLAILREMVADRGPADRGDARPAVRP